MTHTAQATTPMMRQYNDIKAQHKDDILFFRLGDFYEMFDKDAIIASKALDITLTGRGKDENRIPMCGVPFHAAENYITKLVDKGFRVAICEQTEEAQAGKGITRREVVKVVTPGTMMGQGTTEDHENRYLAACYGPTKEGRYGAAFLDVSTGYCAAVSCKDRPELDQWKERIGALEWLSPHNWTDPNSTSCQGQTYHPLDMDMAESDLKDYFDVADLSVFGIQKWPETYPAIMGVLEYAKQTQRRDLIHVLKVSPIQDNQHVYMDDVTLNNLELIRSNHGDDKTESLFGVLNRCQTAMGARYLKQLIKAPFVDVDIIKERLTAVGCLMSDIVTREEIRESLATVYDLERVMARMMSHLHNPRDCMALKQSLESLQDLHQSLEQCDSRVLGDYTTFFSAYSSADSPYQQLIQTIQTALNDDVPVNLRDGGVIRPGYSQELDALMASFRDVKEWMAQLETVEKERTGIKSLKVRYNKVFGYYIEVSNSYQSQVPEHYVRKQTLTNAERYITPELKEKEQLLLTGEERQKSLEQDLYIAFIDECRRYIKPLQELAAIVADLDVLQSFGLLAQKYRYVAPEFVADTEKKIYLEQSRHPILERQTGTTFIPNTIEMTHEKGLFSLITGPNMAGKSTVMRQVALTVIMAQMGCFVPAEKAVLSKVDKLFTRIGAMDNLSAGQSTFMVEMVETARILHNATPNSLILLDEIGRGTSTFDGISIAAAVSTYIMEKIQARTFFATHYHELTELSERFPILCNYSMKISETADGLVFQYQLGKGAADKSYGIVVAKMAGIPDSIIQQANNTLAHLESQAVQGLSPKGPNNQLTLF